ncbi:hypothetical protein pb186bvf_001903 [Paramecium bursaria]
MAQRFLTINLKVVDYDKVFKIDVEYDTLINELIDQIRQELNIPDHLYIIIQQGSQQLDPSKKFEYYNFRQGVEIILKTSSASSARTEPQSPQVNQQQNIQQSELQMKNQQATSDKIILVVNIPDKDQVLNIEVDLSTKIQDLADKIKQQLRLEHTIQLFAVNHQNQSINLLQYNQTILQSGLKKGDTIEAKEIRISGF